MKKYFVIIMLCLVLAFCNVSCGYNEGEILPDISSDYKFKMDYDGNIFNDGVIQICETDSGLDITSQYCFQNAVLTTDSGSYEKEILIDGYVWHLDDVKLENVVGFDYASTFSCEDAKYKKVGQVSYKLSKPGTYIFCSTEGATETCTIKKSQVYDLKTDSNVRAIYKVVDDERFRT